MSRTLDIPFQGNLIREKRDAVFELLTAAEGASECWRGRPSGLMVMGRMTGRWTLTSEEDVQGTPILAEFAWVMLVF